MKRTPLQRKTHLKKKRAMPRRKKKTQSVKTLRNKLDRVFSEYIRRRDSSSVLGFCECCSCGTLVYWREMDAGHFVSRGKGATRYDERNVHAQCKSCNRFRDGNGAGYAAFLIRTYGPNVIEELLEKSKRPHKWRVSELRELLDEYTNKLRALKESP